MNTRLRYLLEPTSVAVVGASRDFTRIGGMLVKYLLKFGYGNHIYPINSKYLDIEGIKCYPSLKVVPSFLDTALIAVAEPQVPLTIEECAQAGIKTAIVYSAGFAETGEAGQEKQSKLRELSRDTGVRICGPNCIGIVNFKKSIAMSFSGFLETSALKAGNVGFVSQSGALGGCILSRAQDRGLGFTYFASTGNEVDLDIADFLDFMVEDLDTKVIMAYIEGVRDINKFFRVAKRAMEVGKPIIALKVGRTKAGQKAAVSHTGSLTGNDLVYSAAFKRYGIVRVEDYDDLIETALLFSKRRYTQGNRVGILTGTGGGGIILADKLAKYGLTIPPLSDDTRSQLSDKVSSFATVNNPLDLTGQLYSQPQMYKDAIKLFANDPNVDILATVVSMVPGERAKERATYIVEAAEAVDKPFVTWWAAGNLSKPGFDVLDASPVALFKSPDRCVKALQAMLSYVDYRQHFLQPQEHRRNYHKLAHAELASALTSENKVALTEYHAKRILASCGITVTREELACSLEHAHDIADRIGYPVVLKISSPQIAHKTEAGGVKVNIKDPADLAVAYAEILSSCKSYRSDAAIEGVLVQETVSGGTEVIVGISKDPILGPTIMFGLGGVFVEILKDISIRLLPLTPRDAREMVAEVKANKILQGVRGKQASDVDAIVDLLLRLSDLMAVCGDSIRELDLNPVMVFETGKGLKVVDALIVN